MARTPWASVDGDIVTLHNIRNFSYRTETDFKPAWHDKTYDLSKLEGIDIVASYWMGPDIAHMLFRASLCRRGALGHVDRDTHRKAKATPPSRVLPAVELYYVVADE
ncbi:MAG: hypothetical protein IPH64_20015 [Comamonadaceae bacterium]|nr:hypothetical protein [Comamonadaceae bacterium]